MIIAVNDDILLNRPSFDSDSFKFETVVPWPSVVTISVAGKQQFDTKVDDNGRVVQDKYIRLDSLTVDRVPMHIVSLSGIKLDTGKNIIKSNYWGFNGTATFNFNQPNSLIWHLDEINKISNNNL